MDRRIKVEEAVYLEQAGASLLLLEAIPHQLAERIAQSLRIPVIGIGAGKHVDGIRGAFSAYARAVKEGAFPGPEHSY
jgi:3-methyl-2-oxobutanoate hydroxymethyltransferase